MNMQAQSELPQFNAVLKKTDIKYLDRARACPFVKWAGGKRALISNIVQVLPESFNDLLRAISRRWCSVFWFGQ